MLPYGSLMYPLLSWDPHQMILLIIEDLFCYCDRYS